MFLIEKTAGVKNAIAPNAAQERILREMDE